LKLNIKAYESFIKIDLWIELCGNNHEFAENMEK